MKKEKPSIIVVPTKVAELVARVIARLVKPTRVPLKYPYIIYSSFEHHAPDCPKKTKVHYMFQTKSIIIATTVTKKPKPDNVPVNVIVTIMTCNQVLER
jgi:hypothetical protein